MSRGAGLMLFAALAGVCAVAATTASAHTPMPGTDASASLRIVIGGKHPNKPFKLSGMRWPTRRITYYNGARKYAEPVRDAVAAWNRSGARIRFVPASRSRAKLKISLASSRELGGMAGQATLGYVPPNGLVLTPIFTGTRVIVKRSRGNKVQLAKNLGQREAGPVLAHELGHVLGLDHVAGCRVMSYDRHTKCRPRPAPWQWRCRLVERDDIRGVVKRYGGRVRDPGPALCDLAPRPPAPTDLTAAVDLNNDEVKLSWKTPSSALVRTLVYARGKTCPSRPGRFPSMVSPKRGQLQTARESLDFSAGRYCYSLWTRDKYGRLSKRTTAWFEWAPPAPKPEPEPQPQPDPEPDPGYEDPYYGDPSYEDPYYR